MAEHLEQEFSRKSKASAGFTLIEMVAVLAIIGIMIVALFPTIELAIDRAEDTKLKTMLAMINGASKIYRLEHGMYPESIEQLITTKYIPQKEYSNIKYDKNTGTASGVDSSGKLSSGNSK